MAQKYFFIAILSVKMSRVNKALSAKITPKTLKILQTTTYCFALNKPKQNV